MAPDLDPYSLPEGQLPAPWLVPSPTVARRVAVAVTLVVAILLLVAAAAPWQQTVVGKGRVIAYAPVERQQLVEAPVDGRIARWLVQEGSVVAEGDVVAELLDNDPDLLGRIEEEVRLQRGRVQAYTERVTSLTERLTSVGGAQTASADAARARVTVSEQRVMSATQTVTATEADLDTQVLNLARHRVLIEQGLVSQRDVELATLAEARARTSRDSARASLEGARAELVAAIAARAQAEATADAERSGAEAALRSAETDLQSAQATLLKAESRQAKQERQRVVAPRDGTVFRILANEGGEQVKAGDPLLVLVPDATQRAVELWLDGNDAAIVSPGRKVRLVFEGWPSVQFSGWPSVAVGTFGGVVQVIDAQDDGKGDFRVLITPDEDDEAWPDPRFLRQGGRANGWVQLDTVRVGFELWRQINGFPPSIALPPVAPKVGGKKGVKGPKVDDAKGDAYGDEEEK